MLPHNTAPVGSIVVSSDGYCKIKTAEPRTWEYLHRKNWEAAHGPIPKGKLVVFRDGNIRNYSIENLELISKKENMVRNSVHNLPEEIKEVIRLNGVIRRKIHGK